MQEKAIYKRLILSLALFIGVFVLGAAGYYIIGQTYGVDQQALGLNDDYEFSVLNCCYMAAITVSTVGYTEAVNYHVYLTDAGEKVGVAYTAFYVLAAYLVMLYASANIVAALVEGAVGKFWQRRKMEKLLEKASAHYIVCGIGSTGRHIVEELVKTGNSCIAIDREQKNLDEVQSPNVIKIVGDATEDHVLSRTKPEKAQGIFAALPSDKDNLFITLTARQVNPNIRIVARATEHATMGKLKKVGANVTISPNHIGGMRMASEMLRPSATSFLDTMLRHTDQSMRFNEVKLVEGDSAAGKSLKQMSILDSVGVNVIAVVNHEGHIQYNPQGSTVAKAGDALIVVCDSATLERFRHHVKSGVR